MNDAANRPATKGVHHLGLTVPDVEGTAAFFIDIVGMKEVARRPDYPAIFVSDGTVMLTLWQAEDPATAAEFDRKRNIGLHHLALAMADKAALDAMHGRLRKAAGVTLEFAPEPVGTIPFHHMICTIPGGVRLEFIAPS